MRAANNKITITTNIRQKGFERETMCWKIEHAESKQIKNIPYFNFEATIALKSIINTNKQTNELNK